MRKIQLAIMAAALASVMSSSADVVINFDDLPSPGYSALPSSYAGFTWGGWGVYDGANYTSLYGNTYANPTAPNFIFNDNGGITVTTTGSLFNFVGADVSTWAFNNVWNAQSSTTVTVNGYLGATLVGTVTKNLSTTSFDWLNANLNGIDRLEFVNDGTLGRWFTLDNFTYSAVPEPTTMIAGALLLLPFGASAMRMLRKNA